VGGGSLYRVDVLTNRLAPGRPDPPPGRPAGVPRVRRHLDVGGLARRGPLGRDDAVPALPKSIAYASMPVAGAIMIGYALVGIGRALLDYRRR